MSEVGAQGSSSRLTLPADPFGAITPLPVTRRADQVVARIQDFIVGEQLSVGDRLPPERELAERFGTSRAIVSQALRTLSLMGLLEIRPGSGSYVTRNPGAMMASSVELLVRTHEGDPEDIAELRYWLETTGATHALERMTPGDLDAMTRALDRMAEGRGQLSAWINADSDFHAALVRASGNTYLVTLYESVHAAVTSIAYDLWVEENRPPRWFIDDFDRQTELHRGILDALTAGDATRLTQALDRHQAALIDHLRRRAD
jgi:GntR family transcriptional regulator, transcriptional repressor for pyruvate dehydrogenase complex